MTLADQTITISVPPDGHSKAFKFSPDLSDKIVTVILFVYKLYNNYNRRRVGIKPCSATHHMAAWLFEPNSFSASVRLCIFRSYSSVNFAIFASCFEMKFLAHESIYWHCDVNLILRIRFFTFRIVPSFISKDLFILMCCRARTKATCGFFSHRV